MDIGERREMLLVALRDGGYSFATGDLRIGKSDKADECRFCFFGVACEEYRKLHPLTSRWKLAGSNVQSFSCESSEHGHEWSYINPPYAVMDYFGIPHFWKANLFLANDNPENKTPGLEYMAEFIESMWKK